MTYRETKKQFSQTGTPRITHVDARMNSNKKIPSRIIKGVKKQKKGSFSRLSLHNKERSILFNVYGSAAIKHAKGRLDRATRGFYTSWLNTYNPAGWLLWKKRQLKKQKLFKTVKYPVSKKDLGLLAAWNARLEKHKWRPADRKGKRYFVHATKHDFLPYNTTQWGYYYKNKKIFRVRLTPKKNLSMIKQRSTRFSRLRKSMRVHLLGNVSPKKRHKRKMKRAVSWFSKRKFIFCSRRRLHKKLRRLSRVSQQIKKAGSLQRKRFALSQRFKKEGRWLSVALAGAKKFKGRNQYLITKIQNSKKDVKKVALNSLDKIFFFFQFTNKFSLAVYKIFIYMELLVYSVVVATGLLKYLFLIKSACFHRLLLVNTSYIKNQFQVLSLYDTISIYNKLNYYFYYQQFQQNHYSKPIKSYFQIYLRQSYLFHHTTRWLLQTNLKNNIPEHLIFDYPNIILYTKPFRRITAFFFNADVYQDVKTRLRRTRRRRYQFIQRKGFPFWRRKYPRSRNLHFSLLKVKLFEYAGFF